MINDYNMLSGIQKVAILFSVVGESLALSLVKGLSKTEIVFVDDTIFDSNFNFDRRVSQIIFGISYRFSKVKKD